MESRKVQNHSVKSSKVLKESNQSKLIDYLSSLEQKDTDKKYLEKLHAFGVI